MSVKQLAAPVADSIGEQKGLVFVQVKPMGKEWYGWYGGKRVRQGDTFYLFSAKEFSHKWMEILKATPEQRAQIASLSSKAKPKGEKKD